MSMHPGTRGLRIGPMGAMNVIQRHSSKLARVNLALFALVWLSMVAAPCVMAMQVEQAGGHDCPHCPPPPCHEVAPDDCDSPDSIDGLRAGDQLKSFELAPLAAPAFALDAEPGLESATLFHTPPARAGPRLHLIHTRFIE